MRDPAPNRRHPRLGPAPRLVLALLAAVAAWLPGAPARGQDAADPSTAGLERSWRELEGQLRLLDQLLPLEPLTPPNASGPLPPLPPGLLAPNAAPTGPLTPAAARPAPPLSLPEATALQGDGPRALRLEDAVALALRNSATLQARRELVAAALAELRASLGTYWPRLLALAGAGYDRAGTRTSVLEPSTAFGFGPLYGPGGPFYNPKGGSVGLTSSAASLSAGVAVRQELVDFARTPRVRAARARLEQRRADYATALRRLQLEVSEAYYQLQQADQLARIREADVRNDLLILADALQLKQAGLVPRLDVLRRRAIEASSQEALIQALADRAVARRRLAVLLNLPPGITPVAADPIRLQGRWPLDLERSLLAAYRGNPELEAVLAARQALGEERQAAVAALLPKLTLFSAAVASGSRDSLWGFQVRGGGCCGASISPESRTNGWDWSIGLSVSWLLFDAGTTASEAEALGRRQRALEQEHAAVRNTIRLRLEQAFFQHEASLAKLASAQRGVAAALEAFRDLRLRYKLGLSNEVALSLTQERLIHSLVQRLNATIDVNRTYAQLLRELLPMPRDPASPIEPQLQLGLDDHQRSSR
ncbi:MAG: TolC family protein [Cyanobacteriota bacterium]|nr:TolC family protein [Cyanobacteriota bacterium]